MMEIVHTNMEAFFSGSHNHGHKIEFDGFPIIFKEVIVRKRDRIVVIEDSEEEEYMIWN